MAYPENIGKQRTRQGRESNMAGPGDCDPPDDPPHMEIRWKLEDRWPFVCDKATRSIMSAGMIDFPREVEGFKAAIEREVEDAELFSTPVLLFSHRMPEKVTKVRKTYDEIFQIVDRFFDRALEAIIHESDQQGD